MLPDELDSPQPAAPGRTRVVVVGSLTMDLTAGSDRLPVAGETVLGNRFAMVPGGKGNNQAIATARQGAATAIVGRIGRDPFGDKVLAQLRADGVNARGVERHPELTTGIAHIRVDAQGQNSIIMVPIANASMDEEAVVAAGSVIAAAQVLLTQLEIPVPATRAALRIAREHGVLTVLNPAPAAVLGADTLSLVDILVPNEFEAATLSGEDASTAEGAMRAARKLLELGCGAVVVTMGERGCVYVDSDTMLEISAIAVATIDTVAAGDAFCGALAAGLALGEPRNQALARATAAGALATTRAGATSSLPSDAEVKELLARNGAPAIRRL
ncbi:MAG: ribokinase [Candidatus Dormibacteria bacterium]